MASLFNAFLSDDEGDNVVIKSKTQKKPAARSTASKSKSNAVKAGKPQPVAKKSDKKTTYKKKEVIEPSQKDGKKKTYSRHDRKIKPGDTDKRNKRYFDRKSGSGRGREGKKGGEGRNNWGGELDKQYNTNFSITGEEQPSKESNEKKEVEEDLPPPEPEKETFTLSEFKKKQKEKRSGEGFKELKAADVEEIKEGKLYEKKEKKELESEEVYLKFGQEKKSKKKESQNRAGSRRMVEGLNFTVKKPDRERNDRKSFRGRGRGRGGRGGRGGFRRQNKVDVDTNDQQTFPQLGAN